MTQRLKDFWFKSDGSTIQNVFNYEKGPTSTLRSRKNELFILFYINITTLGFE